MSNSKIPIKAPQPVHPPEPSNIPVLLNQMDPVFNDTATYNIPSNQTFSPYADALENASLRNISVEEPDPVQSFFREAENQAAVKPAVSNAQTALPYEISDDNQLASAPAPENPNLGQLGSYPSDVNETTGKESTSNETQLEDRPTHTNNKANPTDTDTKLQRDEAAVTTTATADSTTGASTTDSSKQPGSGIDYQSLLDTISQSNSTAPNLLGTTVAATESAQVEPLTKSLPSFPGLPPKPPPLESQSEFSSYSTASQPHAFTFPAQSSLEAHQANFQTVPNDPNNPGSASQNDAPRSAVIQNDHSTNPLAVDPGHVAPSQLSPSFPPPPSYTKPPQGDPNASDPADRPWTPQTQSLYDAFLDDERRYVTEGIWDRFPLGSRLFVGNLPSEKVTKRDLFHRFHKHGRLAQISIKQAYGFVQYHDAASCLAALNTEQGVEIRGRKVHLEISKPQKNTRNAGSSNNKNQARRRSRSPERNQRRSSDFREDSSRRRDEYRNRRSPSPRGYHGRTDHRHDARDERRSPAYTSNYSTPQPSTYDDEASLPIPRRDPRHVPDVQLIVMDPGVHQSFINWVEDGFRRKGLQAMTVWLGQRLPLAAVVKRQIVEGVQAVIKLTSAAQTQSKVPLQVFDRTSGASNVNFNEYADLDVQVAADVVIQARQRERGHTQQAHPSFPQVYPVSNPYGQPPPPMPYPLQIPQQYPGNPQHTPTTPYQYPTPNQSLYRPPMPNHQPSPQAGQSANLQELLANLKGSTNPTTPRSAQSISNGRPDLAALLGGNRPQNSTPSSSPYVTTPSFPNYSPNTASQQPYGTQAMHNQPSISPQQSVQDIMQQLARFQR